MECLKTDMLTTLRRHGLMFIGWDTTKGRTRVVYACRSGRNRSASLRCAGRSTSSRAGACRGRAAHGNWRRCSPPQPTTPTLPSMTKTHGASAESDRMTRHLSVEEQWAEALVHAARLGLRITGEGPRWALPEPGPRSSSPVDMTQDRRRLSALQTARRTWPCVECQTEEVQRLGCETGAAGHR